MSIPREIFENKPYPRFILLMEDADSTYRHWVTVYSEQALELQMDIARNGHPNIRFELIEVV